MKYIQFKNLKKWIFLIGFVFIICCCGCIDISSNTVTPTPTRTSINPTDINLHTNDYDEKTVTIIGQVITSSTSKIIYDGNSGLYLEGAGEEIQNGYYQISGIYHAKTDSITIQSIRPQDIVPQSVDNVKQSGKTFNVVKVQGLAASPPANAPISSFVVYNNDDKDGFYLIISPNKALSHNFAEVTVIGTLIKQPDLPLGNDFVPADFNGIIYANDITYTTALPATVQNIIQHPENYAFKRVIINGIYSTGSSKLGYKKENANYDPRIHFGVGVLSDEFLPEDKTKTIVAIDPVNTDWQIRKGKVTGTVLYPTKSILKYFAQKGINQVHDFKPVLVVEDISEEVEPVSIDDLYTDLIYLQGQNYDGKVVKVTGYALGANVPVKEVIERLTDNQGLGMAVKMIPADVNVQGTMIADNPQPLRQLPLAGLNSELIEGTQMIMGKYEFKVVVTIIDNKPLLFLINKKELPSDYLTVIPTSIPTWTWPVYQTTTPTPSPTWTWPVYQTTTPTPSPTQPWTVSTTIVPTPTITQNQKAMWANGDINPGSTPMSYYQDSFKFDHNDRSIGVDLGSPRKISSIDIRNFGRAWSRLSAGYIDIYYSDDNSHYTFYMGTKTYTKNFGNPSINYVRIGNLNVPPSRFIKIHQTRDHDTIDDGDCETLLDDATGWPRVS